MKHSCFKINKNKNHEGFSCQRQSFLKESAEHKSERNFQGALLLEKEN